MTRDEILAKEPGRELDAAVAEEMGIYSFTTHDFFGNPHLSYFDDAPDGERNLYSVPHYSTDISAAWPLFAELPNANILHSDEGFAVEIWWMQDDVYQVQIETEWCHTAPEAICKAYLLWRESENDEG